MYNNPYLAAYNSQTNLDRINEQITQLENLKKQMQQPIQPTNLTQNFQLAPNNRDVIRYANSMDEVSRETVIGDTPFFTKDMTVLWLKNVKGDIKTYELNEILPKDSKDIKIEYLQAQIEDLKKEMRRYEPDAIIDGAIAEPIKSEEPANVPTISKIGRKSK